MKRVCASSAFVAAGLVGLLAQDVGVRTTIPSSDVLSVLDVLREDLVPAELRRKTAAELAALWPDWVKRRDAAIRARVADGDEDSLVYFLLFGTSFTSERRVSERDLAALALRPAEGIAALRQRIADFVTASASPGDNERLQFARETLLRIGIDPASDAGQLQARRFLEERAPRVAAAGVSRSSTVLDPSAAAVDALTVFRDRGLSSDTSIFINHGVDEAIAAIAQDGARRSGSVRRVAVVGPGLDFTDKLEGYDFYPQQTIQPFAIVDSLARHGLAAAADVQVTALDLSPRVIRHLEAVRQRAHAGRSHAIALPRNVDRPWTPALVNYWERAGDRIATPGRSLAAPPGAGRVQVRTLDIPPRIVAAVLPLDLNVVVERLEPPPADQQFDLVVATNILLYYDVFEQALAAANIARMLRPGGLLLTNNRLFELPPIPLREAGHTDVTYMALAGIGDTGDRIVWYQRQ
jgi:SAM-dependent methyltransferase